MVDFLHLLLFSFPNKKGKDDMIVELKKHYTNEQTGISYTLHGDFYLPDLKAAEENITLGKWGMLHKDYLEKYKKALFVSLLMQGKLYQHCAETENQARQMFNELIEKIVVHEKRIDTDGKPTRDIEIYYRFVGRID